MKTPSNELSLILDEIEERAKTRLTEAEKIKFLTSDVPLLVRALRDLLNTFRVEARDGPIVKAVECKLTAILNQGRAKDKPDLEVKDA